MHRRPMSHHRHWVTEKERGIGAGDCDAAYVQGCGAGVREYDQGTVLDVPLA